MDYSDRWSELLPQILDAVMDTYDPQGHTVFKVLLREKTGQIGGTVQSVTTPMLPAAQQIFQDTVLKQLIERRSL